MAEELETVLWLKLKIGKFPSDRNEPEDYAEYLHQSDHTIQECEIVGVEMSPSEDEEDDRDPSDDIDPMCEGLDR